jgi:hypothetical protein
MLHFARNKATSAPAHGVGSSTACDFKKQKKKLHKWFVYSDGLKLIIDTKAIYESNNGDIETWNSVRLTENNEHMKVTKN